MKLVRKNAVLLLLPIMFSSMSALAVDGTVTFTGNIVQNGCTVDSTTKNITVDFGTVAATSFTAQGQTAGNAPFQIILTNCPDPDDDEVYSPISVNFDGTPDSVNTALLANTGTAGNVGIAVYDWTGEQIPFGASTANTNTITPVGGSATLNLSARMMATATSVTPGTVAGVTNFTILYN